MPGHRFFVEVAPHLIIGPTSTVTLSEPDAHHARDVLRLPLGAEVTIIIRNSGESFEGTIEALTPCLSVRLTAKGNKLAPTSRVRRVLFALCKGDRNDLVCEKATELGVATIHFFQAERSVVRLDSATDCEKKQARWKKIAEGAAKQCGRVSVPEVVVSRSLKEALHTNPIADGERLFFCSLSAGSKEPSAMARPPGFVHICIGPEGDLTAGEELLLASVHGEPLTLGPTVLRSETAAIVAIAMSHGVWGYSAE